MDNRRYMIIILGSANGIDDDLDPIADSEHGVNYVDGTGIFIATFYSHLSTDEIYSLLVDRPAFLLFDITSPENYMVNLPNKYFKGLFPEIMKIIPNLDDSEWEKPKTKEKDLTDVDEIIDKLQANNFDRACLTDGEKNILDNFG